MRMNKYTNKTQIFVTLTLTESLNQIILFNFQKFIRRFEEEGKTREKTTFRFEEIRTTTNTRWIPLSFDAKNKSHGKIYLNRNT